MKTNLLTFIFILVSSISAWAQGRLEVTIENIREVKGTLRVGLYTDKKRFLKEAADGKVLAVSADTGTVIFENLKRGSYAISVIHDENDNGELDSNVFGVPKEGFAFGNNAIGILGPAPFDKAKVELENDTVKQVLVLKYY